MGLLPPPVRRHLALWSPDFPLFIQRSKAIASPTKCFNKPWD